jgi:hypothetical protein
MCASERLGVWRECGLPQKAGNMCRCFGSGANERDLHFKHLVVVNVLFLATVSFCMHVILRKRNFLHFLQKRNFLHHKKKTFGSRFIC